MTGAQLCFLSRFSKSIDKKSGSFQKYILAYMLLANDGSLLLKEVKKNIFQENLSAICVLDHLVLKKKISNLKSRQGGAHNGQKSSDCLIPGLHDDIAIDCLIRLSRSDYTTLACLNKRFNLLIGSGYLYKLRRHLGIIEHWVYIACSLMPWEAFDPFSQRWMRLPPMPCDECFSYADKESLAVGTQLLVFGRELTGLAIWMYSLLTRDWSRCPTMNLPRCLFGSGSSGEIAIAAGGVDKDGHVLKCAELYNSELGIWETLPDMHYPRKLCSGFFMDGKFYVIGGMSSYTNVLTCGEEYNLETRTWRRIEDMYPRLGSTAQSVTHSPPLVAVVNNQLYAADLSTNDVKRYDKAANTWSFVRKLPVRADNYNGWGLAFKACGEKLLVVAGQRGRDGELLVLHSWSPDNNGNGGEGEENGWEILCVRERAGGFVYNCAIMGC